jgi:two-component system, NtrC family, response regulator GlrR
MLILDFDPDSGLCIPLRDILESCYPGAVETRRFEPGAGGLAPCAAPAGPGFPFLIFAILSAKLLESPEALLQSLRRQIPEGPIIAVMDRGEPERIFQLLELGVEDFLVPPLRACDVLPRVWRLLEREDRRETIVSRLKEKLGLRHLIGESPSFIAAIEKVPLVARCDASVLISGETGTGKELVARAIHYLSLRARKPFIAVNCGAIPIELVENELFGHERSAYTGALTQQDGVVREAEGGSLLLDEVDSLPLLAQVKVLRFLQEKEFRPLGSNRVQKADVRVMSAANGDLERAVEQGRFRPDLYYRLNVVPLALPSLRDRREDIPRLARHFLAKYAGEMGRQGLSLSIQALQVLLSYDWPGNVRELEHVIERAVVLSHGDASILRAAHVLLPRVPGHAAPGSLQEAKARAVAQFEITYIRELLLIHQGNISHAAKAADKNRRAFWELIRKHGIDVQPFRVTSA